MADQDGTGGPDNLTGTDDGERIRGLGGNDVILAGDGDDTVQGGAGDDELFGEGGRDNITGGTGKDLLAGGDDNDRLNGESGADELIGGPGNDALRGGSNNDTYTHSPEDGDDTIQDWTEGDQVILAGHGIESFDDLEFVQSGTRTTLVLGDDSITFLNTTPNELSANDFAFLDNPIVTLVVPGIGDFLL